MIRKIWHAVTSNFIYVAVASFIWLLIRTGTRPSRIAYPCQQAALTNAGLLTYLLPALYIDRIMKMLRSDDRLIRLFKSGLIVGGLLVCFAMISYGISIYTAGRSMALYKQSSKGPLGLNEFIYYATIPSAMDLPSPNRVVSVHDSRASSWTGGGSPHGTFDQGIIDAMMAKGLMELTEAGTARDAWAGLVPYETGQAVAVKLNFNNAYKGACSGGWTTDHEMNPYAELINSVIAGLKSIGVPSDRIWITDPSRPIPDAFRSRITDSGVRYYTHCSAGGRANVYTTGYVDNASPQSSITEARPGIELWVNPAQVFVDADHIINIPQLKGHGIASITLGMKNHFGSVDFCEDKWGFSDLHQYFDTGSLDTSEYNLLADIHDNPVFRNKTRLVIGDGLMGHSTINYQPPHTWNSFGNNPPEILFFGADPVAVDSVMTDYINRENQARGEPLRRDDVLVYAASIGLGVFEHWDGPDTRNYSGTGIDYVEVDFDSNLCKNCTGDSFATVTVEPGQTVNIVISGRNCDGNSVDIEYYEIDRGSSEPLSGEYLGLPVSGTIMDNEVRLSWEARWFEDNDGYDTHPEIQFVASCQGSSYESTIMKIVDSSITE